MPKPKILIIGWDGATFDIIGPLVDQGRLPHIASIMRDGVWGKLESTIPPLTPVAWTSISTGVNPGKHGIYDAMVYMPDKDKVGFMNATMRKVKPVWSMLSEHGNQVGVMNIPGTYPPDRINGFVISGMFTPGGATDFIYPPELKDDIEERFGKYIIECSQTDNPSVYLKSIIELEVDAKERVASYLLSAHPLDFFFVAFMASDRVQHFYWKYLDPLHPEHHRYGNAIAQVYERMDQALGRLLSVLGPDTNIMVVSDHGSGPLTSAFFLNNWLMKNGYLHLKRDPNITFKKNRLKRIRTILARSIEKALAPILGKVKLVGDDAHQDGLSLFWSLIDWDRTTAFSEGVAGGIYINHKTVQPEEYDSILSRLSRDLCEVRDQHGKKVVKAVHKKNQVYTGDYMTKAPDLTIICNPGYQIIAPNELLYFNMKYGDDLFLPHRWSARHEEHGIFVLKGPAIKKNNEIKGCRVLDIAPTVMYLMNEAIPAYMDGRVLSEAITEDYLMKNAIRYTEHTIRQETAEINLSDKEEKEIAERLKYLGYME